MRRLNCLADKFVMTRHHAQRLISLNGEKGVSYEIDIYV